MTSSPLSSASPVGLWSGDATSIRSGKSALFELIRDLDRGWFIVQTHQGIGLTDQGAAQISARGMRMDVGANGSLPLLAFLPPSPPEKLGDPSFRADHRLRYAYIAGAMANGVASVEIVLAMARAGMLGFFGAAGLPMSRVEAALDRIQRELGTGSDAPPYGFNLIHSPHEPALENGCVDLYLKRGVHLVEASAFLNLTLPLIRYRVHGIHRDANGAVITPNRVIGKVSRIEVARRFFAPPPERFLAQLVQSGEITPEQAELAKKIPVAQDLTAEADSGGHTDNQPFVTLLPTLMALRDEMQREQNYTQALRVGAAGGIGTPLAASAAFAMGASYILTGSINQACIESGTSDLVRKMLADTRQADVAMAPAADMFEMGVRLQVLKRGTMFAMRAAKLYEWYRTHESMEALPAPIRAQLEKDYFRAPVEDIWRQTREFFDERDPAQSAKAEKDPRHKMALLFRWYLGLSSGWAQAGLTDRQVDFQIWCGPAMGAFNEWVKGTELERPENRKVADVAIRILCGAAVELRWSAIRSFIAD